MNRIDERLLGLAWQVGQTQGVVEDLLVGFRTGGLADGVGMPPGAFLPVGLGFLDEQLSARASQI
jgi:hypothetical protein